nr:hypothetical protein GCM10025732_39940 [Glycomyces mayteni]
MFAQVEGTFNERLAAAWARAGGPGLQIGMDTPQVTPELLDAALAVVTGGADAALGLAEDGGWWALGLARPHPEAFADVPMSTGDTGRLQRKQLEALGLEVADLPVLRDLDDAGDARALAALAPRTRTAARVRELFGAGDTEAGADTAAEERPRLQSWSTWSCRSWTSGTRSRGCWGGCRRGTGRSWSTTAPPTGPGRWRRRSARAWWPSRAAASAPRASPG